MTLENKQITLDDIKLVRDVLKQLSGGWAKKLAAKMFPAEEEEKALDKIYNIISGSSGRDQESRAFFINSANELKGELEQEQQTALNNLKTMTE